MTGRRTTRGGRLAVLLAALLAAVLTVLTAGPSAAQAQTRTPRPPASAAAEEHLEGAPHQEAPAPAGRSAGRHRANGGPPARPPARSGGATAPDAPPAPAHPAPTTADGPRPAALARLQVFRC
ncbi:hypothetical protein [Kitasatospora cineracea]|uniref:Uncharacterized protein n=1 Tax=Kitasatospora cineracea TaxID=88074 RepID=A0A3N4RTD9_9ACTN|nr:hypothetical protein [Kitasatospora cineracea]RPE36658.1 hypothetical protein EDD38_5035 [Kitasatospora cineracea]